MLFKKTSRAKEAEIVENDHFVGIPLFIHVEAGQIVRAGTPISADGLETDEENAFGILLYDVSEKNPNGTVIVHGLDFDKPLEISGFITADGLDFTTADDERFIPKEPETLIGGVV